MIRTNQKVVSVGLIAPNEVVDRLHDVIVGRQGVWIGVLGVDQDFDVLFHETVAF